MTPRFTLRQLEYFIAVGEAGSIATASARVNVSSPSISAAIGHLETEFGLQLFVRRHGRGLLLTRAGQRLIVQARAALGAAHALRRQARDLSRDVRGPLAVGCLSSFAQLIVPNLRRAFEARHEAVDIVQTETDQQGILEGLRAGSIDVALTYDLELPNDLDFASLVELPPYIMVAEAHPLAGLPSVTVAQLRDHAMVLLDLPISGDYFQSLFAAANVKPDIRERTRDMAVMRSLVGNGFGFGIANISPLSDVSPDGKRLKFIPMTGPVRPLRLGLLMTGEMGSDPTLRAFADHCAGLLAGGRLDGRDLCVTRNEGLAGNSAGSD